MARRVEQRSVNEVMKGRVIWLVLLLFCTMGIAACKGSKSSSVEGKLVDGNNKPLAGVKITATQVQPIKGYEQFEAVTGADGSFALKGLFPSSAYVLKPWSDKWTTKVEMKVDSAPQGEIAVLPHPMQIRFEVSAEGMIVDSQTGLTWVVGPDKDTNYTQAEQLVAACTVAGGGWRMPTKSELKGLYQQGVGERNMDPAFETIGMWVWAEPRDSSSAWFFGFGFGGEDWLNRDYSSYGRVFLVRSRPR